MVHAEPVLTCRYEIAIGREQIGRSRRELKHHELLMKQVVLQKDGALIVMSSRLIHVS